MCSGPSQVKVLFAGQDIDRSPFMVNVSKAMGDPSRVQARGPGLQHTGNVGKKPTYFDIYTAGNSNLLNCIVSSNQTDGEMNIYELELDRGELSVTLLYLLTLQFPSTSLFETLSMCCPTRGGRRRRGRDHCGLKQSEGHGRDRPGEQR